MSNSKCLLPKGLLGQNHYNHWSTYKISMHFCADINNYCWGISLLYDGIYGIHIAYGVGFWTQIVNMDPLVVNLHVMFCQYIM